MVHPGCNEIEWLADLKAIAEAIGSEVFGTPITWRVETSIVKRRKRSDVRIELGGELLITGEAKRPDDPKGVNPLVSSEVDDAVAKAQDQGAALAFTTNFLQIAVFDAKAGLAARPLTRLEGGVLELIPREAASNSGWWAALTPEQKREVVAPGLQAFFQRVRVALAGAAPGVPFDQIVLDFFAQITAQLVDPLANAFIASGDRHSADIRHRALLAGLDPTDDHDAKYLIAQGVFEVLSAVLFYRLLQDHFATLRDILRGTQPRKGTTLENVVTSSLKEATNISGDYQSILLLTPVGRWTLRNSPPGLVSLWSALISFIEQLDLERITGDVIGSIFERLIAPDRRHAMGQHYTQPRLARSMAKWGVVDAGTAVLDPTCGAGTFLVETYSQHQSLGLSHDEILGRTFGNDVDPFAVHLAAINLATRRIMKGLNYPLVRLGDAFELRIGTDIVPEFVPEAASRLPAVDLVITNPPYGRRHPNEEAGERSLRSLLPQEALPDLRGINFGAWFVLLGAGLTKPAGRMAFVLQSAVLQNDNLASWRRWIRRRWDLVIWHTEDDVWFSDARVATCVILFTPRAKGATGNVAFVNVREPASGELHIVDDTPAPAEQVVVRDLSGTQDEADLLIAGTVPEPLLRFSAAPGTIEIGKLARCESGAGQKLGHEFFKLRDLAPDSTGVLRNVEGMGIKVRIKRDYLTPLLSGPKELASGAPKLTNSYLLTLPRKLPASQAVRRYIQAGIRQGVHKAPSVAARGEGWWSIDPKAWDIAIPMNAQFRHEVAWLEPQGVVTNNFNALRFEDRAHAELVGAALSSAFGALARLYISGEIGCEGAHRVLLTQFVMWSVLNPDTVEEWHLDECVLAYREWRALDPPEIDEMSGEELATWRKLTVAVSAAALGTSASRQAATDLADEAIMEARATAARRRLRETNALGGRTRQRTSSGSTVARRLRMWAHSSPRYRRLLELLTSGSEVHPLRREEEIAALGLFGDSSPLAAVPKVEVELARLLGVGFDAAWPDPAASLDDVQELVELARDVISDAVTAVIGEPPVAGTAANNTWQELRMEAIAAFQRHTQVEVRGELA